MRLTVRRAMLLAALWGLGLGALIQAPFLADPTAMDDDVRQHAFWMYEWDTGHSGDLLASYNVASVPWMVRVLYRGIRRVMDPLLFTKLFPLPALAVAAAVMAGTAGGMAGPGAALLAGILMPLHAAQRNAFWFGVANAGDLGPLLFITACAALLRRRSGWLAGLMLLEAMIYPPLYALLALTTGLLWAGRTVRGKWRNRWRFPLVTGLVGVAAVAGMMSDAIGPMAGAANIAAMPEFGPAGRTVLRFPSLWQELANCRSGACLTGSTLFLLGMAGLGIIVARNRSRLIPPELCALLAAGTMLYLPARSWMLHMYEPSRFFKFSLPISALLIAATGIGPWLRGLRERARWGWVAGLLSAAAVVYLPATGHPMFRAGHEALYRTIAALPAGSLITGHPLHLDYIPILCNRRVLVSHELAMPYRPAYYRQVATRLDALFTAYFSRDNAAVEDYLRRSGATHLLVWRGHFTAAYRERGEPDLPPRWGRYFWAPYGDLIQRLLSGRGAFVLATPPENAVLYTDGEYILLDVGKYLANP